MLFRSGFPVAHDKKIFAVAFQLPVHGQTAEQHRPAADGQCREPKQYRKPEPEFLELPKQRIRTGVDHTKDAENGEKHAAEFQKKGVGAFEFWRFCHLLDRSGSTLLRSPRLLSGLPPL